MWQKKAIATVGSDRLLWEFRGRDLPAAQGGDLGMMGSKKISQRRWQRQETRLGLGKPSHCVRGYTADGDRTSSPPQPDNLRRKPSAPASEGWRSQQQPGHRHEQVTTTALVSPQENHCTFVEYF